MSRSRAIETRLEKLNPSLDEYFASGFLTRQEVVEVARKRTHWEYRLVAKPLLLLDIQKAIEYELQLEERLKKYCAASMLNLRHRWTVQERIEGIYRIGFKNLRDLKEKELLRQECVEFLKKFGRNSALSRFYGEWMVHCPTSPSIWVEAAEWTAIDQGRIDDGRALIQQALVTMASEPTVWASAVKMEFHMVQRLLRGLLDSHRAEQRRQRGTTSGDSVARDNTGGMKEGSQSFSSAEKVPCAYDMIAVELREENESMGNILLDLALVKTVVESALDSPACGPTLIYSLLTTAAQFPFSEPIIRFLCRQGVERAWHAFSETGLAQRQRVMWEKGLCDVIWNQVAVEHFLVYRGDERSKLSGILIVNPEMYLAKGGAPEKADATKRLHAVGLTLLTVCELRSEIVNLKDLRKTPSSSVGSTSSSSGGGDSRSLYIDMIEKRLAEGVSEILDFLQRFHLLSIPALSSLACLFAQSAPLEEISTFVIKLFLPSLAPEGKKDRKGGKRKRERSSASSASQVLKAEDLKLLKDSVTKFPVLTSSTCRKEERVNKTSNDQVGGDESKESLSEMQEGQASHPSLFCSWPIQCFSKFIRPEDVKVHLSLSSASTASMLLDGKVDGERIERFLLWWKSADHLQRSLLNKKTKEALEKISASKEECHREAVKLLRQAMSSVISSSSSNMEVDSVDLLLRRNAVTYVLSQTPIALWKLYNVLELMHGEGVSEEFGVNSQKRNVDRQGTPRGRRRDDSSCSSSSDSEEEERKPKKIFGGRPLLMSPLVKRSTACSPSSKALWVHNSPFSSQRFSCYATAGIEFLSSVCRGSLNSTEEWEVVEGVCTLLRSRFSSLSGQKTFSRENMQSVIRQHGPKFVRALEGFLAEIKARCLPTPRYVLVSLFLPFYEAMILEEPNAASRVTVARGAYEDLLGLYNHSSHLDHYAPLLCPGPKDTSDDGKIKTVSQPTSQKALVRELNARDWMEYVHFERQVAKDLPRAKEIMERARRLCLAPQTLLILNHTSEVSRG